MDYKMIVLDLDGTLTNAKKEITPHTKEVLMRVQKQGIMIVLASGRPPYGIEPLAKKLQLSDYGGYILAFNGGKIINCRSGNTVYEQKLAEEYVPQLYKEAHNAGLEILSYNGDEIVATSDTDQYVLHEAFINKMRVRQLNNFCEEIAHPINKCLIVGDPKQLRETETKLSEKYRGQIDIYRSAEFFLECVPLGIDKAESLARLIDRLSICRKEIMACGDGYNDLSMIRFAGLGVAMDNAAQEVKDAADYVTLSNEEDGVAAAIEKYVFKK